MTVGNKYSFLNRDNLTQPSHMQLSQNKKNSTQLFSEFLKSRLNFENFQRKDDPHSWCISELTDSAKGG